jgi:hypothetical protein
MSEQTKWRFCAKCHVMFYNGFDARGSCPHDGGAHAPQGLNFQLPYGGPETDHAQRNWRFCRRCFAMYWAGATTQVCNRGGGHDPTGSLDFSLPHDLPETVSAQSNWRFCDKCSDLFWAPAAESSCSAGGPHAAQGWVFTLPHRADHVYDSGPITSNLPLGGWAHLVVQPNGGWTFSTHAHDSGLDNIDYALGAVLVNRFGIPFTFAHQGHVEGTSAGLPFGTPHRDNDQTTSGTDPRLAGEYDNVADADLVCSLTGTDKLVGGIDAWLQDLAQQALAQLGKAAVTAVVAAV